MAGTYLSEQHESDETTPNVPEPPFEPPPPAETPLCQLAAAAKRGDRAALAGLLRGLQDALWRFCRSQLGEHHAAEEAVQETAARLIASIRRFRGRSTAKTWALGIALNVCREWRRRGVAVGDESFDDRVDPAPPADAAAAAGERSANLRHALAALPERQREAVLLRYFEQLSIAETADAMGCADGTVKATLSQALRRLKQKLREPAQPAETTDA